MDAPDTAELLDVLTAAAERRDAATSATTRRERGVVHTPSELARFMVDWTAQGLEELGHRDVSSARWVDPACGPGVFLAAALAQGARHLVGMDIDASALETARAALEPAAAQRGAQCALHRTNTLETTLPAGPPSNLPASPPSGPEALAIVGNPPWATRSKSRGTPLSEALLEDFRRDASGARLGERKIGVLSDDYVRFWRWAAEMARRADAGAVVTLVTNASFLDGPIHRGMRGCLSRWFSRIDILDLGGSALLARSGRRDENVFGVRPGVAIARALRHPRRGGGGEAPPTTVSYRALRGTRREKLARLREHGAHGVVVDCRAPRFLFVPGPRPDARYESWPSLGALMPFHREGLQTNRDAFCVDTCPSRLRERLAAFADGCSDPRFAHALRPTGHFDPERARAAVQRALLDSSTPAVVAIAYRPFDHRYVAPIASLCHRRRPALMRAIEASPFALLTVNKDRGNAPWCHAAATRGLVDNCFFSTRSSCRTRAFPTRTASGAPNLGPEALARFAQALDETPSPESLAYYVLAVLASPRFQAVFQSQLRLALPRIPPPEDERVFRRAAAAGQALEAVFASASFPPPHEESDEPIRIGHHKLAQCPIASPTRSHLITLLATCDKATAHLWT